MRRLGVLSHKRRDTPIEAWPATSHGIKNRIKRSMRQSARARPTLTLSPRSDASAVVPVRRLPNIPRLLRDLEGSPTTFSQTEEEEKVKANEVVLVAEPQRARWWQAYSGGQAKLIKMLNSLVQRIRFFHLSRRQRREPQPMSTEVETPGSNLSNVEETAFEPPVRTITGLLSLDAVLQTIDAHINRTRRDVVVTFISNTWTRANISLNNTSRRIKGFQFLRHRLNKQRSLLDSIAEKTLLRALDDSDYGSDGETDSCRSGSISPSDMEGWSSSQFETEDYPSTWSGKSGSQTEPEEAEAECFNRLLRALKHEDKILFDPSLVLPKPPPSSQVDEDGEEQREVTASNSNLDIFFFGENTSNEAPATPITVDTERKSSGRTRPQKRSYLSVKQAPRRRRCLGIFGVFIVWRWVRLQLQIARLKGLSTESQSYINPLKVVTVGDVDLHQNKITCPHLLEHLQNAGAIRRKEPTTPMMQLLATAQQQFAAAAAQAASTAQTETAKLSASSKTSKSSATTSDTLMSDELGRASLESSATTPGRHAGHRRTTLAHRLQAYQRRSGSSGSLDPMVKRHSFKSGGSALSPKVVAKQRYPTIRRDDIETHMEEAAAKVAAKMSAGYLSLRPLERVSERIRETIAGATQMMMNGCTYAQIQETRLATVLSMIVRDRIREILHETHNCEVTRCKKNPRSITANTVLREDNACIRIVSTVLTLEDAGQGIIFASQALQEPETDTHFSYVFQHRGAVTVVAVFLVRQYVRFPNEIRSNSTEIQNVYTKWVD